MRLRSCCLFAPHTLADRSALHRKVPFPVLPAYVRESQKIQRLGSSFSSSFPVLFGVPPELDPARFSWMELQPKLSQPLLRKQMKNTSVDYVSTSHDLNREAQTAEAFEMMMGPPLAPALLWCCFGTMKRYGLL
jgi:hypothetical protein